MKYLNTKHSRRKGVAIELAIMLLLVMVAMGIMLVSTTMIQINKQKESFNDLKEITQEIEKMEKDQLNRLILDNIKNFEIKNEILEEENQIVDIISKIKTQISQDLGSVLDIKNYEINVTKNEKTRTLLEVDEIEFPEEPTVLDHIEISKTYNIIYTDENNVEVPLEDTQKHYYNIQTETKIENEKVEYRKNKTEIYDIVDEYTFTILEVKNSEKYIVYSFSVSLKSVETKIVSTIKTCDRVARTISTVKTKVGSNDQPLETKNTTYEYVEDTIVESKSYSFSYEIINQ